MAGSSQLTLLGSGVSDYLEPLFNREHSAAIMKDIRACLNAWSDWNLCDWQDPSHDTPLAALGEPADDTHALLRSPDRNVLR
jgi:hypothetical protein